MFHKLDLVEDSNGKQYVQRVYFDTEDAIEALANLRGYEGKSFYDLFVNYEIRISGSDKFLEDGDVLEFSRPISLDKFLLMFKDSRLEDIVKVNEGLPAQNLDRKRYVV